MSTAKKIEKAINKSGISKYAMLDLLGISESTWFRWLKNGFPKMAVLALCHILGTTEQKLTGEDNGK